MKFCVDCGLNYEDEFPSCPGCAGALPSRDGPEVELAVSRDSDRPDGSVVIPIGVGLLIGGLLLAVVSGIWSPWFVFGAAAANLGTLMLLVGYVVKAISFLPGSADD